MTFSIPESLFLKYYEVCDEFINNNYIGKVCKLVYPPRRVACECTLNPQGINDGNVYPHGGPAPFNFPNCEQCGGTGYKEVEYSDNIRLRVYWRPKDWLKVANISFPEADAQIIGYASDLPKVRQASYLELITEQLHGNYKVELATEPFLHGFGHNRYFVAFVKRAA